MKTLNELFRHNATIFDSKNCLQIYQPDKPTAALYSLTHKQFYHGLLLQARQLQQTHKLKPADTIALLADNSLAYLLLTYAAGLVGIKVLLISTKVLPEHLQYFLDSTACKLLFFSGNYAKLAEGSDCPSVMLDESLPLAVTTNVTDHVTANVTDNVIADISHDLTEAFEPEESDCVLILHTSGTTSIPRLVYLSHQNILGNQKAVDVSVRNFWTSADSSLSFLPLFHGYAILSQFLRNTSIGATTVLYQHKQSPTAENLLLALERTKVTFFCCVPWMLKLLHDLVLAEQVHGRRHALEVLQNLKFIITAGALLDQTTGNFFAANKVKIITVFGLTEAAGFVMHSSFDSPHWDLLQPLADAGIQMIPTSPDSDACELVLAETSLVARTFDAANIDTKVKTQRSYHTSDLFIRSKNTQLWSYLGRSDQIYNGPQGEKINPVRFETELEKHSAVLRAYVSGEDLLFNAALVQLKPEYAGNASGQKEQVLDFIQAHVNPLLELPARVYANDVFILAEHEAIPVTPKGSINRKTAKDLLAQKMHEQTAQTAVQEHNLSELVYQQIRAYLKWPADQSIPAGAGFIELGFDSLMLLSLRNTLQQTLKTDIPLELMLGFPQVAALITALAEMAVPVSSLAKSGSGSALPVAAKGEWANIPLEQVIFHTAHYIFPFPTYNVSMSLLAPGRLDAEKVKQGIQYLEAKHEILRSIYTREGTYTIEQRSKVDEALLGITEIEGSHDVSANPPAMALIGSYLNCVFDLSKGPIYRYGLIHITDAFGHVRTLIYLGLNHAAGDFKAINALLAELMEFLERDTALLTQATPVSDSYSALIKQPTTAELNAYQACWLQVLTVMPQLKEGLDFRAGYKQQFSFRDVNLKQVAEILRKHNISLYNGVYAVYAVVLSRYLTNQSLENFLSATAVTSRITAATESLMGCFIHSPILRFNLQGTQSMLQMMTAVQRITGQTFSRCLVDPVSSLQQLVADPANLVPFISRNVFLYRSPDEIMVPLSGWDSYRNELFFDACDVGMYFDFCASATDQSMEGYVLINRHYCEPNVVQPIMHHIHKLIQKKEHTGDLDFLPTELQS